MDRSLSGSATGRTAVPLADGPPRRWQDAAVLAVAAVLTTVVTRLCLDELRSARACVLCWSVSCGP